MRGNTGHMKVTNITLSKNKKKITLSADIRFNDKRTENAYFAIDRKNESLVFRDASPFLAALLLPGMKMQEDIFIDGSVSTKLLRETERIMTLIESWNIDLHRIKITARETKPDTNKPEYIASFFSAGVDSFYTYLKNKKENQERITHLLLVHGFDIPLQNKILFKKVQSIVTRIAKEEKIQAVFVETNIAEIIEKRLIWDFAHGGALAAVGLFLRKNLKDILIAGNVRQDELFPYGTHPDLDKLWSTETLQFVHDGTEYNRLDKIMHSISKSPLALTYLHVCSQNVKGKYNCARCYKCLQTMIELVCANALQKAKTFPHTIDLQMVRKIYYDYSLLYNQQGEANLAILKKQNREPELQKAIAYSLMRSKKPSVTKRIVQGISYLDQKYNRRRLYTFIFRMDKKQDRNIFFKLLSNFGILK